MVGAKNLLNEYGGRPTNQKFGFRRHIRDGMCDARQLLTAAGDHFLFNVSGQVAPRIRRNRHHIGDGKLGAGGPCQPNRALKGGMRRHCGIDVNENPLEWFHVQNYSVAGRCRIK
jgi:hypothetical protein